MQANETCVHLMIGILGYIENVPDLMLKVLVKRTWFPENVVQNFLNACFGSVRSCLNDLTFSNYDISN